MPLKGRTGQRRFSQPKVLFPTPFDFPLRPQGPVRQNQSGIVEWKPPDPPASWRNSKPEWWVFWWLTKVRKLRQGTDFITQASLNGGRVAGGIKPDFMLMYTNPKRVIAVNGVFWHTGSSRKLAKSEEDRLLAHRFKYDYVIVWDDELQLHLDYVMRQAVDYGREVGKRPYAY